MNSIALYTPVLLLAFNRPENTKKVFESIRKVKPKKLYVAIDGPRLEREDDLVNCNEVKNIVKMVDWDCETHYLFHEKNLGCSRSGFEAWKWLFEKEDRMIFVEDDGLGNESAFFFVQDMLERYKNDERIAYVGGVNYGPTYGSASYFYSRLPSGTYFMGTWKRVFDKYEYNIESFQYIYKSTSFMSNFFFWGEYVNVCHGLKKYYHSVLANKRLNTYDQQMIYLSYKYNMYSIYPNINMVSNIGLDDGANNHTDVNDPFYLEYGNRKMYEIGEIIYQDECVINKSFERLFFQKRFLYNESIIKMTILVLFAELLNPIKAIFERK